MPNFKEFYNVSSHAFTYKDILEENEQKKP